MNLAQFKLPSFFVALMTISACSTMPSLGGGGSGVVTGGAGGSASVDENSKLAKCDKALGTVSIFEDTSLVWWSDYRRRYPKLGSTIPVIRLMVQQSNCFVVVERGRSMDAMQRERALMSQGELRGGSNFGKGQMVAADYTITPSVLFAEQTGGIGGMLRSFGGSLGKMVAGQMKSNEAETNLTLIENRSGVQVASANGSAENQDFGFLGGLFGGGAGASVGGFSRTPEGKVVTAAFADSFNEMVKALRNYKPQAVKGGLGKGGGLKIGGDDDKAPLAKPQSSAPSPAPVTSGLVSSNLTIKRNHNINIKVDDYDSGAMKDYYRALKGSVENLGTFAGMSAEQVRALKNSPEMKGMGAFALSMVWGGPFVTQLETAQIELASWPLEARRQAWAAYGPRIKKYNKIFERHRSRIIENKAFDDSVYSQLQYIELLNETSLFQ